MKIIVKYEKSYSFTFLFFSSIKQSELWTRICELKRELGDKEQALSKMQREKEELFHQKEDLEARLRTYKSQQRQTCVPCRSCKPVHTCTCTSGASIITGDTSARKVFTTAYYSLKIKCTHMYTFFALTRFCIGNARTSGTGAGYS